MKLLLRGYTACLPFLLDRVWKKFFLLALFQHLSILLCFILADKTKYFFPFVLYCPYILSCFGCPLIFDANSIFESFAELIELFDQHSDLSEIGLGQVLAERNHI